jgi:hypothetical protein
LPVECIAELGSTGAIAVLALLYPAWRDLGRITRWTSRRGRAPAGSELAQLRCYADAMRGAIIAIIVSGIFLSLLYASHLWVLLAVSNAMPFVLRRTIATSRRVGDTRSATPGPGGRERMSPPLLRAAIDSGAGGLA